MFVSYTLNERHQILLFIRTIRITKKKLMFLKNYNKKMGLGD